MKRIINKCCFLVILTVMASGAFAEVNQQKVDRVLSEFAIGDYPKVSGEKSEWSKSYADANLLYLKKLITLHDLNKEEAIAVSQGIYDLLLKLDHESELADGETSDRSVAYRSAQGLVVSSIDGLFTTKINRNVLTSQSSSAEPEESTVAEPAEASLSESEEEIADISETSYGGIAAPSISTPALPAESSVGSTVAEVAESSESEPEPVAIDYAESGFEFTESAQTLLVLIIILSIIIFLTKPKRFTVRSKNGRTRYEKYADFKSFVKAYTKVLESARHLKFPIWICAIASIITMVTILAADSDNPDGLSLILILLAPAIWIGFFQLRKRRKLKLSVVLNYAMYGSLKDLQQKMQYAIEVCQKLHPSDSQILHHQLPVPSLQSDIQIPCIKGSKATFYFFPDHVLIDDGKFQIATYESRDEDARDKLFTGMLDGEKGYVLHILNLLYRIGKGGVSPEARVCCLDSSVNLHKSAEGALLSELDKWSEILGINKSAEWSEIKIVEMSKVFMSLELLLLSRTEYNDENPGKRLGQADGSSANIMDYPYDPYAKTQVHPDSLGAAKRVHHIMMCTIGTHTCSIKKEPCPECHGTGHCTECDGRGFDRCSRCDGTGVERVSDGYYKNGNEKFKKVACSKCHGSKRITCRTCEGLKKCHLCEGAGEVTCSRCGGSGYYQTYRGYADRYYRSVITKTFSQYAELNPLLKIPQRRIPICKGLLMSWYDKKTVKKDFRETVKKEGRRASHVIDHLNDFIDCPSGSHLVEINLDLNKIPVTEIRYQSGGSEHELYIVGESQYLYIKD